MKTISLLFPGMVIPCLIFAQSRLLSMEEASLSSPKLSAKTLAQIQWNGDADTYFFVAKNALVNQDILTALTEIQF